MKINLNDILVNSYDRNMKELIVIYDNKDNVITFTYGNIPDKVKNMKIERFYVASEKLSIIILCEFISCLLIILEYIIIKRW